MCFVSDGLECDFHVQLVRNTLSTAEGRHAPKRQYDDEAIRMVPSVRIS
jgi:hypothetical protein